MIPKALMSGKILQLTHSSPSHTGSRIENTRTEQDESSGHSRENDGFLGSIPGEKRGGAPLQNPVQPECRAVLLAQRAMDAYGFVVCGTYDLLSPGAVVEWPLISKGDQSEPVKVRILGQASEDEVLQQDELNGSDLQFCPFPYFHKVIAE